MLADELAYNKWIRTLTTDSLLNECMAQKRRADHNGLLYGEARKSLTATAKDFQKAVTERDTYKAECIRLQQALDHMQAEYTLGSRDRFGSRAEGLDNLLGAYPDEIQNPIDEDAREIMGEPGELSPGSASGVRGRVLHLADPETARHGSRKKGDLKKALDSLPKIIEYEIDPEALNREYGEYGWSIAHWHEHCKVETRRTVTYLHVIKTPVLSIGLGFQMVTLPFLYPLFQRSILTPSLMAEFLYNKFFLHLPFYRQEQDMKQCCGFAVSRQTMIRWAIRLATVFLQPVYKFMCSLEADCPYQNADETYLRVITEDGSKPGKKYYVWVFSTGELAQCNPVIVYLYGPSRSARVLLEHLGIRDFLRIITCDSYVSYKTAEAESKGKISVSCCLGHARRRWVYALEVIRPDKYTDEQLMELPEVKALLLIQDVYLKDTPLKQLPCEERLRRRGTEVRPAMEAYLDFVHSLNSDDASLSEKTRDAISYTINQENYLTKFLDDGSIPADNAFAERNIKSIALGRRNWLFADTPDGAKTCCIFDTFVATAKANNANIYYYLKYLIEQAPNIPKDSAEKEKFLPDLMPWSGAYQKYERDQKEYDTNLKIGGEDPPAPKTPRKKDKKGAA